MGRSHERLSPRWRGLATATIVIAMQAASVGVAHAHHPVLAAEKACLPNGSKQVTWTVSNSETTGGSNRTMIVTAISVSSGAVDGIEVADAFPPRNLAGSTQTATSTYSGSQTGNVTLTVTAKWIDDAGNPAGPQSETRTKKIDLGNDACDPPSTNDCKIEGGLIGANGLTVDLGGKTITFVTWVPKADAPGEFVGFTITIAGGSAVSYVVKAGTGTFPSSSLTWINPNGTSGSAAKGISNIDFCGDEPGLTLSTQSDPSASNLTPGVSATDTIVATGTDGTPTGTVSFYLCGPGASGCADGGTKIGADVALSNGTATSASTGPLFDEGRYCWRAEYHGDDTYEPASHTNDAIGDDGECFEIDKRTPAISTQADPSGSGIVAGTIALDVATVSGAGGPTPTGTVTFFLCDPSEVTGSGCPNGGTQIGAPVALSSGTATSASTDDTTATGTYCWRAEYSGDHTYDAASHTNDDSECFTVARSEVTIVTQSSPSSDDAVPGSIASDTLTITGQHGTPTGSISFYLCGPDASGCADGGTKIGDDVTLVDGSATSASTGPLFDEGRYCWRAEYHGDDTYDAGTHTNDAIGDDGECFEIAKRTPLIATTSSPQGADVLPGTSVSDTAILTGQHGTPTGTVTFFLCSPAEVTAGCETGGTPIGDPVALDEAGTATSASTSDTLDTGTYCWRAEYSGDQVYTAASHTNTTSECFIVVEQPPSPLDPVIATLSDPTGAGVVPGTAASDTATVSGPEEAVLPTGTVTFFLCAPGEVTENGCETGGTQIGDPVTLVDGVASSSSTGDTAQIGTFCWRAEYSGDDNYLAGSHTNADSECFTTEKQQPAIATIPVPDEADTGDPIRDTATVTGGVDPTGTVTFELHGPGDTTCSADPLFVDEAELIDGAATSGTYVPQSFGIYRWVATYSGDELNLPAISGCDEELVLVTEVLGEVLLPTTGIGSSIARRFGWLLLATAAMLAVRLRRRAAFQTRR